MDSFWRGASSMWSSHGEIGPWEDTPFVNSFDGLYCISIFMSMLRLQLIWLVWEGDLMSSQADFCEEVWSFVLMEKVVFQLRMMTNSSCSSCRYGFYPEQFWNHLIWCNRWDIWRQRTAMKRDQLATIEEEKRSYLPGWIVTIRKSSHKRVSDAINIENHEDNGQEHGQ